jgi:polyhydroxyalkanoate synthesis regulator phasin
MITLGSAAVAWRCSASVPPAGIRVRKASIVTEAFQSYINMVTGVTKSTQAKATATARALFKQAGLEDVAVEASERVTKLTEEIMNASRTNRELLQHYVTAEVDKAAGRLGFARAEDVQVLRDEVASLRARLDVATASAAPAKRAAAKKARESKAGQQDLAAKNVSAHNIGAKNVGAKKAPARKSAATTRSAKKGTGKKSASRKPARKTAAPVKRGGQSSTK